MPIGEQLWLNFGMALAAAIVALCGVVVAILGLFKSNQIQVTVDGRTSELTRRVDELKDQISAPGVALLKAAGEAPGKDPS